MTGWFGKQALDPALTLIAEPFVHPYMSANIWHLKGRDVDLLVDTGMGICPLAPEIDTPAGKPLLVVATHIHLDHVGSLHEFADRAGPAQSAAEFARMGDAATYAHEFRELEGAVSRLPLFSIRLRMWRISAGVISVMGRFESGLARSVNSQRFFFSVEADAPLSLRFARCSSAIAPNVLLAAFALAILSSFFCCDGSMPLATSRRASVLLARASASDTSGNVPSESIFSLRSN